MTIPRPRRFRRVTSAVAVTALFSFTTACGGGSGTASSGSSGTGPAKAAATEPLTAQQAGEEIAKLLGDLPELTGETVRGVNGKVITVGGTGTNTKAGQHTLPGLDVGARARFERANREGGVNGYTFEYAGFQDDNGQPAASQHATQNLVESKQVFALVPYVPASGVNGDYIAKHKVPTFGWLGQDFCTWDENPWMYSNQGQTSCPEVLPGKAVGSSASLEQYLKATGKDAASIKFGVFASSDPYGKAGVISSRATAENLGLSVVYAEADLPSATEPPLSDYTPIASRIMASGANVVAANVTAPALLGVLGALKSLGWTGDMIYGQAAQALLDNPGTAQTVDGMIGTTAQGAMAFGGDSFAQVSEDLKAIGSDAPADGIGTVTTYWAADLFLQAFAEIEGEPTAEKLANVLNGGSFGYEAIQGVTCSQSWPAGRVLAAACAGVVTYDAAAKKLTPLAPLENTGGYFIVDAQ
ncbi:ABC transporter substrate-binding protein [Nonomuraea harbinensis]|uniref:ABC transporter substrate-binding protein n=1 Tax=Nonomuraea harbinensis TaxID=1286938 RepID=A0ABW1C1T6_9ACTN|nr:ABC transporter substrate-binding protein [Nonomuraea harbinensis]